MRSATCIRLDTDRPLGCLQAKRLVSLFDTPQQQDQQPKSAARPSASAGPQHHHQQQQQDALCSAALPQACPAPALAPRSTPPSSQRHGAMATDVAMDSRASSSGLEFKLHPLVLINVSDHYTRYKANAPEEPGRQLTVMGCLLGSQDGRTVDVANSFEIVFAETEEGFHINHAFLLKKQEQYKTVFPKQDVVGWYVTGRAPDERHRAVHRKISELIESPVLLLLNPAVDHARKDLPLEMLESEMHVHEGVPQMVFVTANYSMETSDAERIGVDQVAKILPSGKATGSEQLTAHLSGLHSAIQMLVGKLSAIQQQVDAVAAGTVPFPHAMMRQVNSLVCSLPALDSAAFRKDYLVEVNDAMAALLLAGVTQSLAGLAELTDKFGLAYDKAGRRGARGGGGMMASSLYGL